MMPAKKEYSGKWMLISLITLFVCALVAMGIGRYYVEPLKVLAILLSPFLGIPENATDIDLSVVQNVRMPRVILAMVVGGGLAVSGAALQGLFNNPLASPDTLGVASGAAFGAAMAMLFTQNMLIIQFSALALGLTAIFLTFMISRIRGKSSILMVVLGGIVVSSFFQALIALVKYVADTETQLPSITYWLMGSMAGVSVKSLLTALPMLLGGVLILVLLRWRINILTLSEEEASAMGIHVQKLRWLAIISATAITAATVSICGLVGWVGLLIPHVTRMLAGTNYRTVIPLSITFGGIFMIVVDTMARSATAAEIPLSILTAIIGAPFFAYLLRKTGGGWM